MKLERLVSQTTLAFVGHGGLGGGWAAVLTISHMDWAGMQESQCTRDSVDCGKVLGTL